MSAPARALVVAISLVIAGAVVHAAPVIGKSRHAKPQPAAEVAPRADDSDPAADRERGPDAGAATRAEAPRVAFAARDTGDDDAVQLARPAAAREPGWHLSIGPYLWASEVSNLSLGGPSAGPGAGVDFVPMERHASYGAEILAEVRHGRLAISGDLMSGSVALTGVAGIGPVMTSLTGNASSLLVDGAVGYAIAGDERSLASLELRGGVRYQRTTVGGALGLGGYSLQTPESVAAGTDALIGARGLLRPRSWFFLSGVFDVGVFGASNTTWSATADANLIVASHVVISLGYRTLTLDRPQVSFVMHGPRAAIQLMF